MGKPNRSRAAGHKWETDCAKKLRELGYTDVKTSRECSRLRDSKKVDLCNADEDEFGRLPFNLQCKCYSKKLNYEKLTEELEFHNKNKQLNIILHRYTEKSPKGRFITKGEWAIMRASDFLRFSSPLYESPLVWRRCWPEQYAHRTFPITNTRQLNYHKIFLEHKDNNLVFLNAVCEDDAREFVFLEMELFWLLVKEYKLWIESQS